MNIHKECCSTDPHKHPNKKQPNYNINIIQLHNWNTHLTGGLLEFARQSSNFSVKRMNTLPNSCTYTRPYAWLSIVSKWESMILNHLQKFDTSSWIGSNDHIRFWSPTNTRNELPIVIFSLLTTHGINGAKFVGSNRHGQRFIVSKHLYTNT